jgi:uncharacterized protein (DUF488 family)
MTGAAMLTLGHGKRSIQDTIELLQRHGVRYLVDVRSAPYSRYQPDFSRDALKGHLRAHDIAYLHMGPELGGRPDDPSCYDASGRVDYEACARRPAFHEGIERLRKAWEQGQRVAVLCSESRPENCHRTKLVGEALLRQGIPVTHLDPDGSPASQQEVMERLAGRQAGLFEDMPPATATRSRRRHQKEP